MAKTKSRKKTKLGSCAVECKGTGSRFQSCVSKCVKGDYRWRKSKTASSKKRKGRCTKWSKNRTRCMRRAAA